VGQVLCVDFGSTFTKAVLVECGSGEVIGSASTPTTLGTDLLDGHRTLLARLGVPAGTPALACSSAGGVPSKRTSPSASTSTRSA